MRRLIDADALKDQVEKYRIVHLSHRRLSAIRREAEEVINDICFVIDVAPTIEPLKHGRWILDGEYDDLWRCSECGYEFATEGTDIPTYLYCPNCGARMDEVEG